LHADTLDIGNITLDDLVTATLQTDNYITRLRAMASNHTNDTDYVLGTDINFDTIVDDDNNNLTQHPTTYRAPKSGYYTVTVSVNTTNVDISIPGHPDSPLAEHVDVFVNGTYRAQLYKEFNKIRKLQWTKRTLLSSLIHINKDDLVTFRYFAVHENPGQGEDEDVPGTATLIGSSLDNATWMIIHYLSSDE
jgi:hypothetical protein